MSTTTPRTNKKPRLLLEDTASAAADTTRDDYREDDSSSHKNTAMHRTSLFERIPLDIIELMLSFLDDECLLKETSVILCCKRMLQASEQLCEKVFHDLVTSIHRVDDNFDQRLQRSIAPGRVAQLLPCRQRLHTAQRTPLRQGVVHTSRTTYPAKLVFSPSHKKFAVICSGGIGYVTIFNTTTMTRLFTADHNNAAIVEMMWLKEEEEEAGEDSFVTRSYLGMLLWTKEGTEEEVWTSREIQPPQAYVCSWTARSNNNEVLVLARPPLRQLDEEVPFRLCSLNLQDRSLSTILPVNISNPPFRYRGIDMFTCGNKWLLVWHYRETDDQNMTEVEILVFNMETNEQVQCLSNKRWRNVARVSESSHTIFVEEYSSEENTKVVTMFRLGEEDGLLAPVVGSSYPVVGDDDDECMISVSESYVACDYSDVFLYNVKTGQLDRKLSTSSDVMNISNKRNELITLGQPIRRGDTMSSTINVYCLGKLPRPT